MAGKSKACPARTKLNHSKAFALQGFTCRAILFFCGSAVGGSTKTAKRFCGDEVAYPNEVRVWSRPFIRLTMKEELHLHKTGGDFLLCYCINRFFKAVHMGQGEDLQTTISTVNYFKVIGITDKNICFPAISLCQIYGQAEAYVFCVFNI